MPDESTHFPPLGEVLQADPYPFHGLAVLLPTSPFYQLRPHDGRPQFQLPSNNGGFTDSKQLPPYSPTAAGILWDIGRPDPPVTPVIYAAGGTAWGRRILNPEFDDRLPARLEGKTRFVRVFMGYRAVATSPTADLKIEVDGLQSTVGTLDLSADFGGAPSDLYAEGTDATLDSFAGATWGWMERLLDCSPDGTRRLFAISLQRSEGTPSFAESAVVGIFEVVLSSVDGVISGSITVHKTATQCLGVYEQSGSNDLYNEKSEETGSVGEGEPCGTTFSLTPRLPGIPAVAGTTELTRGFSGMILGASYAAGEIIYHELDRRREATNSATWSRPAQSGVGNGIICVLPARQPATSVHNVESRQEATLRINGRSTRSVREYTGGMTRLQTSATNVVEITARWGVDTLGALTITDTVGRAADLSGVFEGAAPHSLGNYPRGDWGATFVVSWRRRWSIMATRWGDYWAQGPMIHEHGVIDDWLVTGVAHFGSNTPPQPINRAAACPATANAVRAVDIPTARDVAYI